MGFIMFPWLSTRLKTSLICVASDVGHALWMILVVAAIYTVGVSGSLIGLSALITGFLYAIWFASTETFLTRITSKDAAQSLNRWVAISYNVGPLAGPAVGALIYSMVGLVGVAILNALSFTGQIFSVEKLGKSEPEPKSEVTPAYYAGCAADLVRRA